MSFETKDSGKREEFATGMVRDTQDDKPRYDLLDLPMLRRWAELMARGAKKYGENNWRKAATPEELTRFRSSAIRHMFQYLEGDKTEDHAAAIIFNVAGAEMVEEKLLLGQLCSTHRRRDTCQEKPAVESAVSPFDEYNVTKRNCCGDCLGDEPCVCDGSCL